MIRLVAIAVLLGAAALPAYAQRAPAEPKPYKPVSVTLPEPPKESGLAALRAQLAAIAQKRDRAALARVVDPKRFFWERDFGGSYEKKKSSLQNFTVAVGLTATDDSGWTRLARFAAEPTLGPIPGRKGVFCAPANPTYKDAEFVSLTEATNSDVFDWSYPRNAGLQVRAKPSADAPVVETLGFVFIRVLRYEGTQEPTRDWAHIATPSGKDAYAPPDSLMSPLTDRLCFGKDASGAWRVVGYVGGGD